MKTIFYNKYIQRRLEEKIANSESENQILRQQALAVSPTAKALTTRPKTVIIQVRNMVIAQNYVYEDGLSTGFCE